MALISSRRRLDAACALAAGAAVVVLIRAIGRRWPGSEGLEGTATAAAISATAYVPAGLAWLAFHHLTMAAFGEALTAGVLSSAVALLCDMLALRRVPAQFFGCS